MPRKRPDPTDPHEWLRRARSNLVRAKNRPQGACLEDQCFDAQQAAEKALKAVLIGHGLPFPFTHDLGRLLTELRRAGVKVPKYMARAQRLTRFAVQTRYPGLAEPVTDKEYRGAVRIAAAVFAWAFRQLVPK